MGSMHAASMAEMVDDGAVGIETALAWHLTSNHYPPLPAGLVPVALEVIEKANAGDWHAEVALPAGISWRNNRFAPVIACVEAWHLDAFLDPGEEY